ncbi:MAG: M20/M25/M40 family metallo-hydrolase [Synergistaceae bacterium]|nr:M20/M25/M40 family metallo-hydrolase [Synergistaceae bacterium]
MPATSESFFISDETGRRACALMLELAAIPSITGSDGGEEACASFIRDRLARLDYFKRNEDDLKFIAVDPQGRHTVAALLRAANRNAANDVKKTVILLGHFDVVDVEGCGPLRSCAFDPLEYTRRAGELALSEDARKDLESGRWLFGRGVADMKAGLALIICLLEEYALRREKLDFNILLLAVPDEEGDSSGMRGVVSHLAKLKEEEGLDFLACVDAEPTFEFSSLDPSSSSPAIYYGTIGKIMPLYLCVGRESHVGEYYEGLNSALIASYLNISLDGAKDTIETREGETFQPQACLRMRDLRSRYAVTLPERTVLYYNCLTVAKTPEIVLGEMKEKAKRALEAALSHAGRTDMEPRVLTVSEILDKAAGALETLLPRVAAADERERNIEFLSLALDMTGEKGPLVVVGFVPPFYPPRVNENESPRERAARRAAGVIREKLKRRGLALAEREIFQGITDLSFTGFRGRTEELAALSANTPLWGRNYTLPLGDLQKIDIPCVLLGPIGKDSHKATERVELDYSFNVLPSLFRDFIEALAL